MSQHESPAKAEKIRRLSRMSCGSLPDWQHDEQFPSIVRCCDRARLYHTPIRDVDPTNHAWPPTKIGRASPGFGLARSSPSIGSNQSLSVGGNLEQSRVELIDERGGEAVASRLGDLEVVRRFPSLRLVRHHQLPHVKVEDRVIGGFREPLLVRLLGLGLLPEFFLDRTKCVVELAGEDCSDRPGQRGSEPERARPGSA